MNENEEIILEVEAVISRLLNKSIEIQALMKDGKFIIAFEKQGGIIKVLDKLRVRLMDIQSSEPK